MTREAPQMYRAHPEKSHEPIQTQTTLDQLVPQDHLSRLEHILGRFGYPLEAVVLDAGYFMTEIAKALVERGFFGVIARRRFGGK